MIQGLIDIHFHGQAARIAERLNARRSLLTISHSDTLAMAQVLLLSE